jgi:diguanylate cyclase (GGDEF)-like protein
MLGPDRIAARFNALTVLGQSCLIVAVAAAGADLLTLVFYSIFFSDRLVLDLLLTSVIVLFVASSLTYFFLRRSARFAELAAELETANRTGELTGLLNRKTFLGETRRLVGTRETNGSTGAMLFIDADHFKAINDSFGHATGDAVLREIGSALKSCIRESDVVGRLGGEEFAVFVDKADFAQAAALCGRIHQKVKEISRTLGLGSRSVTVSIGLSAHEFGQELEALLSAADRALYVAKSKGRDCTAQAVEVRAAA